MEAKTRSFCYVSDLVDAVVRLMATSDDFYGPVNLGNSDEFTIRELAELTIELTDSRLTLDFVALPPDDPEETISYFCKLRS